MPRVWIDTDVALGAPRGDVDDAFAIAAVVAAAKRGDVELLGVSAVSGNTDGATALRCARALVDGLGAAVPVVGEDDAAAALAELPEGTRLLAIGPPTNVVRASAIDPTLPDRVDVWTVGTVLDRARHPVLSAWCLNLGRHPIAAQAFLRLSFRRRVICPLDVVCRLAAGAKELDALADVGAAGDTLAAGSRRWLRAAPLRFQSRRFPVWDLVAALDALEQLPGRVEDAAGRLTGFDAAAAWAGFVESVRALR